MSKKKYANKKHRQKKIAMQTYEQLTLVHFPYLARPLGPLFASNPQELAQAKRIRERVLRMMHQEANAELDKNDHESDGYHGYLVYLAYLRTMFWAEEWLKLDKVKEGFDIMVALAGEVTPFVAASLPATERECYEQEQVAVRRIVNDPQTKGLLHYFDATYFDEFSEEGLRREENRA